MLRIFPLAGKAGMSGAWGEREVIPLWEPVVYILVGVSPSLNCWQRAWHTGQVGVAVAEPAGLEAGALPRLQPRSGPGLQSAAHRTPVSALGVLLPSSLALGKEAGG